MTFGQPFTFFIQHQFAMKKFRRRQTQRTIKQNLPRRAHEQIRAAHNFGNFHRRVVNDTSKLIRRNIIVPPDDEIAKIFSGDEFLFTKISICERNRFTVGNAKAPVEFGRWEIGVGRWKFCPTSAGINRLVTFRVRRSHGLLDVSARAGAGINEIPRAQFFQTVAIKFHPPALIVRRELPADVRSFAPFKTEPAQVFNHFRDEFHFETRRVQIFISQNQFAADFSRALLCDPKSFRVTEVQITRRRWREASAIVLIHRKKLTARRKIFFVSWWFKRVR